MPRVCEKQSHSTENQGLIAPAENLGPFVNERKRRKKTYLTFNSMLQHLNFGQTNSLCKQSYWRLWHLLGTWANTWSMATAQCNLLKPFMFAKMLNETYQPCCPRGCVPPMRWEVVCGKYFGNSWVCKWIPKLLRFDGILSPGNDCARSSTVKKKRPMQAPWLKHIQNLFIPFLLSFPISTKCKSQWHLSPSQLAWSLHPGCSDANPWCLP